MSQPVLETRDLTIRFGGHVAVDGVSAAFHAGTLTAIVGPNGAGKTTYFNLISGQLPATSGNVLIDGVEVTKLGAARRAKLGIGRAFQLTNLFPNLTVHENVRLAVQAHAGGGADIASRWNSRRDWINQADRFIEAANLADKHDTPAVALPHGDKRKLEVAIMMALEPHVFMFDEPTAGMSVDDVPVILDLIKKLKSEGDKTILLVEHKMDVVKSLADRIVVLHNGRLVADGEPAEVIGSAVVQEAYLGRRGDAQGRRRGRPMADALLTLEGVHTHIGQYHILQGVDFAVPRGDHDRAARPQRRRQDHHAAHHHGAVEAEPGQGDVRRPRHRRLATPDISRAGIAYVPESMGVFADLTVQENMILAAQSGPPDSARLDWIFGFFPALKRFWTHPAGVLSGGQKQMLSIARAIIEPRTLILIDEPTKGIAPAIIDNMIRAFKELKRDATTILLVEQNFRFAEALGDFAVVMDDGRIVHRETMAELAADTDTQTRLLGLSLEAHG